MNENCNYFGVVGAETNNGKKLQMIKIEELTLFVTQLKSGIDHLKKN